MRLKQLITILLTFILVLCLPMAVSAQENTGATVNVTTDKRVYNKGDNIQVTVEIQNRNSFDINNVSITNSLPDGLTQTDGNPLTTNIPSLKAGEKTSVVVNAKTEKEPNPQVPEQNQPVENNPSQNVPYENQTGSDGTKQNTNTMDAKCTTIIVALMIISLLGLTWCLKNRKEAIRKISIILFLIFSAQLASSNIDAIAAEVTTKVANFNTEKIILVGEESLNYKVGLSFNYELKEKNSNIIIEKNELKPDEDTDKDGLTNGEEAILGTDPNKKDSDSDSLSDYNEAKTYNTNPLNPDTDNDGVLDGEEIAFNLNPLEKKSSGSALDGTNTFEKEIVSESKNVSVKVKGNSGIVSTTIDEQNLPAFNSFSGLYSKVQEFHCNEKIESAIISFSYSDQELKNKNMKAENLSIFYFNEQTKAFEKIPSTIDTENKVVKAEVKHFSSYALADSAQLQKLNGTQISFLIDNSGSMYPKALCSDSSENDVDFKRVDFANALVDKLSSAKDQNFQFSASKFTKSYTSLCNMTSDSQAVKNSISSIKDVTETFNGTHIGTSMQSVLNSYSNDDYTHKKYVVLLTDGETTEGQGLWGMFDDYPTAEEVRDLALNKGVVVFAVGLGNNVDKNYLMKMSTETGGDYFIASDANALDEIYKKIVQSINYNNIDTNNDGTEDTIVVADSGFNPSKNGFSFANGSLVLNPNGFCYGMAEFAERYYTKTLPLSLSDLDINNAATLFGENFRDDEESKAQGYDLTTDPFFSTMLNNKSNDLFTYTPKVYLLSKQGNDVMYDKTNFSYYTLKPDIMKQLEDSGYVIKKLARSTPDTYYDKCYLDVNSEKFKNSTDNTELQLFKALSRLFITQRFWDNIEGFDYISDDGTDVLNELKALLNKKIPTTINLDGHTVNAIRLTRDKDDPNIYKLYMYDNNFPGEETMMNITRTVIVNSDKTTSYTFDVNYSHDGYEEPMKKLGVNPNRILEK